MTDPEAIAALLARTADVPRFRPLEVDDRQIEEILAAATRSCPPRFAAPPWRFVVLRGSEREELIARMAEALARHWGLGIIAPRGLASDAVLDAPVLVLVLAVGPAEVAAEAFAVTAGAAQNLLLLAAAHGLATHRLYSAHVVTEAILDFVGERLGPELRGGDLVGLVAIGYSDAITPPLPPLPPPVVRWLGRGGEPATSHLAPPPPPSVPSPLRSPRGDRVLIADPYRFNRAELGAVLQAAGYVVESFRDAQSLLAAITATGEPDLYLVAESLSDMSGFELARRLAARGAHAPIVIATSRRDAAFRIAGLSVGVDYYLRKPVNPLELLTVAQLLRVRHGLLLELKQKNQQLERLLGELRAAQAQVVQQAKMAALGQLVAGVAHEINTPLGAVVSNNDLFLRVFARLKRALDDGTVVLQPGTAEQLRRDLAAVTALSTVTRTACGRISAIVRTLRTFARLDEAEVEAVDLHQGLESSLTLVAHQLPAGTTIVRDFGSLPRVECHGNQINQVFMNLLVNAGQAMESGGTLTIRTRVDGERVRITVRDTGRGIPAEHLERIFDPGFTTKDAASGTGLGLMISEQIVADHGGAITVESAPGLGTSFEVTLPVRYQPREGASAGGGRRRR